MKLEQFITIKKGKAITKNNTEEGPYPVILGGKEPAYFINQFNHEGPAIVVSRSGASAGYVSYWDEPIFITDGFLIDATEKINHRYLYYLLKSKQPELQGLQQGAAIPHVTPKLINNLECEVPDLQEQLRIASILSAYDDLIENNQKQIKLLEEAAQRLYKEWFVDLRFPGYEKTRIVEGVPEGWKKASVTDLLEIKYGKDHKALADGNIPVYGSGGVMRKVSKPLHTGESVLIPRKGTLNNIFYVSGPFWTIDTMFYSVPRIDNVAQYVYLFLKGIDMESFNTGAAVPSMTVQILSGIITALPDSSTLRDFVSLNNPIFDIIKNLYQQIDASNQERDKMLDFVFQ